MNSTILFGNFITALIERIKIGRNRSTFYVQYVIAVGGPWGGARRGPCVAAAPDGQAVKARRAGGVRGAEAARSGARVSAVPGVPGPHRRAPRPGRGDVRSGWVYCRVEGRGCRACSSVPGRGVGCGSQHHPPPGLPLRWPQGGTLRHRGTRRTGGATRKPARAWKEPSHRASL